jgi:hypothetical protein
MLEVKVGVEVRAADLIGGITTCLKIFPICRFCLSPPFATSTPFPCLTTPSQPSCQRGRATHMNSPASSTPSLRPTLSTSLVKLAFLLTTAIGNALAVPLYASSSSSDFFSASHSHHDEEPPRTSGQLVVDCLSIAVSPHDQADALNSLNPFSFLPWYPGTRTRRWSLCWSNVSSKRARRACSSAHITLSIV